jgi:hypothetical protein
MLPALLALHLDEMFAPEIRPQVHNLPRAQSNKHTHSPQRKPLDPLIGTLIRVPQLLFPRPQIIHLRHNLANDLFNAPQLRFHGLQFLARRDGVPVLCVGANVNVELDVARRYRLGGPGVGEDVLETDVEGGVGMRGECVAVLANYVFGAVVVVAHCVADLTVHN